MPAHTKIVAVVLLSLFISPAVVRAETVVDIKLRSARECSEIKSQLASVALKFSSANELRNLPTDVKQDMKTKADQLTSDLSAWCTAMSSFPGDATLATVSAKYNELKTVLKLRDPRLNIFNKMNEVDGVYARFATIIQRRDSLVKNVTDFSGFSHTNDAAIATQKTTLDQRMIAAATNLPTIADYTAVYNANPDSWKITLERVSQKLAATRRSIDESEAIYRTASKLMTEKMTAAAWENVSPTDKGTEYQTIYRSVRGRVTSIRDGAIRRITSTATALTKFSGQINAMTYLDSIKGQLKGKLDGIASSLTPIAGNLTGKQVYGTEIKPQLDAEYKLKAGVFASAARTTLDLHQQIVVVEGKDPANKPLTQDSGLSDIKANMQNLDKVNVLAQALDSTTLATLGNAITAIDLNSFVELERAATMAYEALATGVTETSSNTADRAKLKSFQDAVTAYRRAVNTQRGTTAAAQRLWYAAITQAASSKKLDAAVFADDLRAAKTFTDFEKRKNDYYASVDRIVAIRTSAIQSNEARITTPGNIPSQFRSTFSSASELLIGKLEQIKNEAHAIEDYATLKAKVESIKELGIENVYLPTQSVYIGLDQSYLKHALAKITLDALVTRVDAISNADDRAALSALVQQVQSQLNTLDDANGLPQQLKTTTDEILAHIQSGNTFLAADALTTLRARQREFSSTVNQNAGKINELYSKLKAAETKAARSSL